MRTAAACFVLAAAIATPGIVVAATSDGSHPAAAFNVTSSPVAVGSGTLRVITSGVEFTRPLDPKVRSTVDAVNRALAAKGVRLLITRIGQNAEQGFEPGTHGRCPVVVSFGRRLAMFMGGPCAPGEIDTAIGPIDFVPASLRATIEQALR